VANLAKRPDGRWRARYLDAIDKEHSRHFTRKLDAQRWLDEVTTSVVTGQYVDPKAGRVTFATFYTEWAARQVWEATTVLAMDLAANSVPFAQLPLADLRRSHMEQWIKQMITRGLAPGTVRTRVNNVRAVLRAAVRDRVIASDPSDAVTLPRLRRAEAAMTLPTSDQVGAVLAAADDRFCALVALAGFADSAWAERPDCRSATSTTCAGCCSFGDRCSAPLAAPSRSARPRTAASARCSWPTSCWNC
jgi:hypothetical protein